MENQPAFPSETMLGWESGMSLRDYFAAKAMQAYLSSTTGASAPDEMIARAAYKTADEMLKAREA